MEGSAAPPQEPPVSVASFPLERTIRFAAYLLGGILALSSGIVSFAAGMGAMLNCIFQTPACPSGSTYFEYDILPTALAGATLIVVAVVLLLFARRAHRSPN